MIRRRAPGIFHQFHPAEFLQHNTTPVCRRTCWLQPALAFAAVLIAEDAKPSFPIPAQSVRTKQSMPLLVRGFDRLFVRHGSPNQPIDVLHCLDLRLHDTHVNKLNHVGRLSSTVPTLL